MADEEVTPPTDEQGRNIFGRVVDEAQPTPTARFNLEVEEGDFDADSPKVPLNEAIRILSRRIPVDKTFLQVLRQGGAGGALGPGTTKDLGASFAELARKIAVLMPPELLTKDALENMDVRAALQQVMMAPAQSTEDGVTDINGVEFTDFERQIAGVSLVTLTEQYKEQWQTGSADRVNQGLDVDKQLTAIDAAVEDALYGYRDGKAIRVPDPKAKPGSYGLDTETGRLVANADDVISQSVADEFNADFDVAGTSIERRFLSKTDIEKMLSGGELTIDYLREIEQADLSGDPTATDPNNPRTLSHNARVTYTDNPGESRTYGLAPGVGGNDRMRSSTVTDPDWYSVTEVLRLPSTFSPEERTTMVKRLERAGFLAKGEVLAGDTTSSAFKNAWKTLAQAALERGVSMTSFLAEREQTYQETIMSSFASRLTDPARLKLSGDTIGRSVLGRSLTDDERTKMIKYVHDLERQNAMTEAGLDVQEGADIEGVAPLDEGITADIDARMEAWIEAENGAEAGAHDVANQYEAFTRMLAGPGRGVG